MRAHPLAALAMALCLVACQTKRTLEGSPSGSSTQAPMPPPSLAPLPALEPAVPLGGAKAPPIAKATLKRFRAEVCYFGAVGLEVAREAYWKSLGAAPPGVGNTPTFGRYPEYEARRRGDKPSLAEEMGRLPFDRHVRSCGSARHLREPVVAELDPALEKFDAFVSDLNRTVADAARYYARREWSRDGFEKGREYHEKLSDTFSGLDEAWDAYGRALAPWRKALGPIEEPLDAGGELAGRATAASIELGTLLLARSRDAEAIRRAEQAFAQAHKALAAHGHKDAPHPKLVGPALDELAHAAAEHRDAAALGPAERWAIASAVLGVIEANHRALAQTLRGDEGPLDALPPRLMPAGRPGAVPAAPDRAAE